MRPGKHLRVPARGLAAAIALAVAAPALATAVSAKELVYGSWVSPRHSVMRNGVPEFMADVKKATNGAITMKLVAGGQLADVKATLPALKDGLFDIGFVIPPFLPSNIPSINLIFATQFFGRDGVAATGAQLETMLLNCPSCLAEARKSGIIPLGGFATTPFILMCREKIATVADMKGKKIRGAGGGIALLRMSGATPVSMSPAAATQALQRGAVDCVLGAPSWLRSYGYQDVVNYVNEYPMGMAGPALHLGISRKTFRSLTPDQRKAFVNAAARSSAIAAIEGYINSDKKILAGAKAKGVTFLQGGKDFDELVGRRQKEQRAANLKASARFNIAEPGKILDNLEKASEKWRKLSKDIGLDVNKFAAALQREVYDKIDPEKL